MFGQWPGPTRKAVESLSCGDGNSSKTWNRCRSGGATGQRVDLWAAEEEEDDEKKKKQQEEKESDDSPNA